MSLTTTPSIDIAELLRSLDAGDALLLLDVRNAEEFAAWRVEGRRPVETIHIPYFAFVEDAAGAVARLPRDRPIVALCAKGGASTMVVDMLSDAGISARSLVGGMVAYGDYQQTVKVPLSAPMRVASGSGRSTGAARAVCRTSSAPAATPWS